MLRARDRDTDGRVRTRKWRDLGRAWTDRRRAVGALGMLVGMEQLKEDLDGIPVTLLLPAKCRGEVVLWLTHLGGNTERTLPMLERFADAGHPAVTFDPILHGARSRTDDPWAFASHVLASFRRRMWPIMGQSTLEAMRVLTWAQERTGQHGGVLAGGVSMGGDIAVALSGIDDRVRRVAAVGSTPNWCRPDMRELHDPSIVVDQGDADRYAQWFADQLDPTLHLDRYTHGAAITFELGQQDRHVPAHNAVHFRDQLNKLAPAATDRVRVQIHAGLDHLGVTTSEEALTAAAAWLSVPVP